MVSSTLGLKTDIGISAVTSTFNPAIIGDVAKTAESFTYTICDGGGISQAAIDKIRKIEQAIGKIGLQDLGQQSDGDLKKYINWVTSKDGSNLKKFVS